MDWFTWFIGFTEGDGSFIVTKRKELNFVITQRADNKHILKEIRDKLGVGTVIVQGQLNKLPTYRFIVRDLKSMGKIIRLFNYNLVLPHKIEKFNKLVNQYNINLTRAKTNRPDKYKHLDCIDKVMTVSDRVWPTSSDGWFSGFTDADGCFKISLLSNSQAFRIMFIIAQKNYGVDKEELCILSLWDYFVEELLETGTVKKAHQNNVIYLRVNGLKNIKKLYPYFDRYLLKTTKYNNYLFFKECAVKFELKDHLNTKKRIGMLAAIKNRKNI